MKTAQEIGKVPEHLIELEISPDVSSGYSIRRKVKGWNLQFLEDCIRSRYTLHKLHKDTGEELTGEQYKPIEGFLEVFCDARGPFVDPVTHQRVLGTLDEDPESPTYGLILYPDGTITRYEDIMIMFANVVPFSNKDQTLAFYQAADDNEEYNK